MKRNNTHLHGFTLIELMVVISIIFVLSGMSLAAYYRFSQRQAAMNDARNFSAEMRKVQALAKNLVYPENCTGLIGYDLVSDCSNLETCISMSINAVCENGTFSVSQNDEVLLKAYFTYDIEVRFEAGTGNISPVGTYNLSNSNDPYQIAVTTDINGNIDLQEL